jgi:hypothetical protein
LAQNIGQQKKIGVFFFQKKRKCSEGKTPSYLKVDVIHEGFHFLLDCKIWFDKKKKKKIFAFFQLLTCLPICLCSCQPGCQNQIVCFFFFFCFALFFIFYFFHFYNLSEKGFRKQTSIKPCQERRNSFVRVPLLLIKWIN